MPKNPSLILAEVRAGFVYLLDLVRDLAENGDDEGARADVARKARAWRAQIEGEDHEENEEEPG